MAVNTLWPVEQACGHEGDHDQRCSLTSDRAELVADAASAPRRMELGL